MYGACSGGEIQATAAWVVRKDSRKIRYPTIEALRHCTSYAIASWPHFHGKRGRRSENPQSALVGRERSPSPRYWMI